MSDQAKWLKLWGSALTDPHLENLSLNDWACYIRLMLYTKCHGHLGKIRFPAPYNAILSLFKSNAIETIENTLKTFPNLIFKRETRNVESSVTLNIHFLNWYKYQVDSSKDRVKKHRDKKRYNVTSLEEKRREESNDERPIQLPRASRSGSVDSPPRATREQEIDPEELEQKEQNKQWQTTGTKESLSESERMTPEEMKAIRLKNFGPLKSDGKR